MIVDGNPDSGNADDYARPFVGTGRGGQQRVAELVPLHHPRGRRSASPGPVLDQHDRRACDLCHYRQAGRQPGLHGVAHPDRRHHRRRRRLRQHRTTRSPRCGASGSATSPSAVVEVAATASWLTSPPSGPSRRPPGRSAEGRAPLADKPEVSRSEMPPRDRRAGAGVVPRQQALPSPSGVPLATPWLAIVATGTPCRRRRTPRPAWPQQTMSPADSARQPGSRSPPRKPGGPGRRARRGLRHRDERVVLGGEVGPPGGGSDAAGSPDDDRRARQLNRLGQTPGYRSTTVVPTAEAEA